MVSFNGFISSGTLPLYMQIILYIKRGIIAGVISDGDEFPSRRVLSALLGINPNTVQKACKILEEEGLLESRSGAKSVISFDACKAAEIRSQLLEQDAKNAARSLKQMGVSLQEATQLIEKYWDGGVNE